MVPEVDWVAVVMAGTPEVRERRVSGARCNNDTNYENQRSIDILCDLSVLRPRSGPRNVATGEASVLRCATRGRGGSFLILPPRRGGGNLRRAMISSAPSGAGRWRATFFHGLRSPRRPFTRGNIPSPRWGGRGRCGRVTSSGAWPCQRRVKRREEPSPGLSL